MIEIIIPTKTLSDRNTYLEGMQLLHGQEPILVQIDLHNITKS